MKGPHRLKREIICSPQANCGVIIARTVNGVVIRCVKVKGHDGMHHAEFYSMSYEVD